MKSNQKIFKKSRQTESGFLLISLIIAIAIISIIIFAGRENGAGGQAQNSIEQGRGAIQKAEEAKKMMEAEASIEGF